jgi:hypothetical protein
MTARQPDFRYECFDITVPSVTTIAAPLVTDVSTHDVVLISLESVIPPGPSGAVGWQLWLSGAAILPWQKPAVWIVEDDAKPVFDFGFEVDKTLQIKAYNLGAYDHTLSFRFKVQELVPNAVQPF